MKTLSSSRPASYFYFHLIILVLVFGGFGLNALVHPDKLPPTSGIVYLHGLIMFLWYILIVIQSNLIRSGNISLHKTLGKSSLLLALGIVVSGIWMSVVHYSRPDGFVFSTINTFILINFIILFYLAWTNRFRAEYHKRYMTFVSLSAVFPALGRIILGLNLNQYLSVPLWVVLVLVMGVHDFQAQKKIHPATKIGTGLILLGIAFTLILMENAAWKAFLDQLMG
ncbi:hypothetical protein D0X99_12995 [Algoriphagus lacus]|uniref:DUF2306 domain-containing protein n=1 Tax=Algoriphagus lacus TaxID=2056311 RepID=A0A418PQA3_9BACT|nr:hypothetical protein [Algoriphagus lacus]RIW14470.1 hypothetical protein D0X99_12995 [Algoriphagus lacus]